MRIDGLTVDQSALQIRQDLSARAIRITNIVQLSDGESFEPTNGEKIHITLDGLRTPYLSDPTDSFQMTTFNYIDDTFYYFIDQKTQGIIISSKCDYPCKDCPDNEPSTCLSCYPNDVNKYLQVDTCVQECAADRYYDAPTDQC